MKLVSGAHYRILHAIRMPLACYTHTGATEEESLWPNETGLAILLRLIIPSQGEVNRKQDFLQTSLLIESSSGL